MYKLQNILKTENIVLKQFRNISQHFNFFSHNKKNLMWENNTDSLSAKSTR